MVEAIPTLVVLLINKHRIHQTPDTLKSPSQPKSHQIIQRLIQLQEANHRKEAKINHSSN